MFCYQCEQTLKGTGCTDQGVCGKDATTAALQDLLLFACRGIATYAHHSRLLGVVDREADQAVIEGLFTTVTNVNFHPILLERQVREAAQVRDRARARYEAAAGAAAQSFNGPCSWVPADDTDMLVAQGRFAAITGRRAALGDDYVGLQELLTYGLKGAAAYYEHAVKLGVTDDAVAAQFNELVWCLSRTDLSADELLGKCLETGTLNLRVMELLDEAHTNTFGHPEPTQVRVEPLKGKAIVVSGHDLPDLYALLQQTEGKGINVYTHGEMLPAHGYPELKKFKHLVGNFGGPWQNQVAEFNDLPGAVLMTTNCIQRPTDEYIDRIFTSGLVAWPGVLHISDQDFTPVIEAALAAPGFTEDGPERFTMVGFGHNAVLSVADKVIGAVKSGEIKHFFLIGGCDGGKPGRNYYTKLAQAAPKDTVILTLACGKYRFNKLEFGTVAGLPRMLDIGQCNDTYSAIKIASALAGAFECGVNDLPLSIILSWYEQKAVAVLLTLLSLGIKGMRIGPSLPAFLTPNLVSKIVEAYDLKPIGTVEGDMAAMLSA
ncbi:MAG: hydroxylamine reductase [Armatimonadetes bacterium]|nr:hydroxylamine reductase [Armatimonadota bacterium]